MWQTRRYTYCCDNEWDNTYQKIAVGTLSNICDNAKKGKHKNPAVIVVGDVVKLRSKLSWYENGRLFGKRILLSEALISKQDAKFR